MARTWTCVEARAVLRNNALNFAPVVAHKAAEVPVRLALGVLEFRAEGAVHLLSSRRSYATKAEAPVAW